MEETLKQIAVETQRFLPEGLNEAERTEFARVLEIALNNLNRIRNN